MKRTTAGMLAVIAVLLAAVPSASGRNQRRVEEAPYNWTTYSPDGAQGEIRNFVVFQTESNERSVSVSIHDVTGMDVAGTVEQDRDGDGINEVIATFCSKTARPVKIAGGREVVVGLELGPCSDQGLVLAVSGKIRGIFTK